MISHKQVVIHGPLKLPGDSTTALQTSVEYFEPATGFCSTVPGVVSLPRSNGVRFLNVGEFSPTTWDGVDGAANVTLLTHGNANGPGTCANGETQSELLVCSFTGYGPANGLQVIGIATATQAAACHTLPRMERWIWGLVRSGP